MMGPKVLRVAVRLALLMLVVLTGLQAFATGRELTVRSWVRLERLWARDVPVVAAKQWLKGVEPMIAGLGLLRPVRVEVESGVSLLLDPADDIARTILISRHSLWEPEVWSAIESSLPDGAVFLDVGAHIGYDTLRAAKHLGPRGRVVAFEPNPRTLEVLRQNIQASRASNVIVQAIACTDKETTLTFYDSTAGGNSGASSMAADNAGSENSSFTVRGRPIDAVMAELGIDRLDVLKADVEGAEYLVLRGATAVLKQFHPTLVLEVVPRQLENMGTSVEELESFIRSLGYDQVRQIDYKNKEYSVRSVG